jgi:hypothetical protein
MSDLKAELAKYIGALAESAARTNRAEDRAVYLQHLAAAALMFFLLQNEMEKVALDKWVSDEKRAYGGDTLRATKAKKRRLLSSALLQLLRLTSRRTDQNWITKCV